MLKVASDSSASCASACSPLCASWVSYDLKHMGSFQEVRDLMNFKILILYSRILVACCGSTLQTNFNSDPFLPDQTF